MAKEEDSKSWLQNLEESNPSIKVKIFDETFKPYVCFYESCTAAFNRPNKLEKHIRFYHEGMRLFNCIHEGCDKTYTNNAHLVRHVKEAHSKSNYKSVFKCNFPGCGKQIRHKGNMKRHMDRWHKPSRKFKYACDKCDKSYPKLHQLNTHMFQHAKEHVFRCLDCNRSYLKECLLKKHQQTHKTLFECTDEGCPEFGTAIWGFRGMRDHLRKYHPPTLFCEHCAYKTTKKSQLRVHMCSHFEFYQRDVFLCPVPECRRFYFYKKNLTVHIKVIHEEMRFPCPIESCVKVFTTKVAVSKHMKVHEPGYKSNRVYKKGSDRKIRKDSTFPKRSLAVKLAGIKTSLQYEKSVAQSSNENSSDLIYKETDVGWVIEEKICTTSEVIEKQ